MKTILWKSNLIQMIIYFIKLHMLAVIARSGFEEDGKWILS